MPTFVPHSDKQWRAFNSDTSLTIIGTGTQWGKSQVGSLWMKRQIHKFQSPDDNFLLMAPTYKIMSQSMQPYFLNAMAGLGDYKRSSAVFVLTNGASVYLRTQKDPHSIVGIPKLRAYWLDEAGLATLYFWENLRARAASIGAIGLLTTSPYSRNWLYRDFIKPGELGKPILDTTIVRAASWENPYHSFFDPVKKEKERATMDPRRFAMLYGGEWGQMAGLVYDCFDEAENQIAPFELPSGTRYYAGVDWGYHPDPFVIKVRAITPTGMHYSISEFYQTGLTLSDMIEAARQKKRIFGVQIFYCDPSQPGSIEEFNRNGLTAIGANNDLNQGIGLHYELIKTRRLKYFIGLNQHSIDELETYHYPELKDLGPDSNAKEIKPVGQSDHACDADRYLTIMTYRTEIRRSPKFPGEMKITDRLKYLQQKQVERHMEKWS